MAWLEVIGVRSSRACFIDFSTAWPFYHEMMEMIKTVILSCLCDKISKTYMLIHSTVSIVPITNIFPILVNAYAINKTYRVITIRTHLYLSYICVCIPLKESYCLRHVWCEHFVRAFFTHTHTHTHTYRAHSHSVHVNRHLPRLTSPLQLGSWPKEASPM